MQLPLPSNTTTRRMEAELSGSPDEVFVKRLTLTAGSFVSVISFPSHPHAIQRASEREATGTYLLKNRIIVSI